MVDYKWFYRTLLLFNIDQSGNVVTIAVSITLFTNAEGYPFALPKKRSLLAWPLASFFRNSAHMPHVTTRLATDYNLIGTQVSRRVLYLMSEGKSGAS